MVMKALVIATAKQLDSKLRRKIQHFFPPAKLERGIARVENVEEVFVNENVFYDKYLVLCENVPPQIDHYLVQLFFKGKSYKIRSHQFYVKNTEVGIEYFQKIGNIKIVKILKKSLIFEN
jgi:hypothetical protein